MFIKKEILLFTVAKLDLANTSFTYILYEIGMLVMAAKLFEEFPFPNLPLL